MPLFALTLFVAAALVFAVQPMIARMVLPLLGGSPSVWVACMVFFQAALLLGYGYAHATIHWLGAQRQAVLHLALLILALGVLPIRITESSVRSLTPESSPTAWLLGLLVARAGLPFVLVAATAPLLQRWFAETGHPAARDPYFLYGASNLGSILALVAYPFAIEPNLRLAEQGAAWTWGYGLMAGLTLACAVAAWRAPVPGSPGNPMAEEGGPIEAGAWLAWVALAFVPSSWMLGVTTYVTTDVAAIPLLWVVPLTLYLLTFVLAFARRPVVPPAWALRALPWLVVPLVLVLGVGLVHWFWIPLHWLGFFVGALACHGELARRRPPARRLTSFSLAIALGGALGGVFNALAAPGLFDRVAEYPATIALACLVLPGALSALRDPRSLARDGVIPAIIGLLLAGWATDPGGWSTTAAGGLALALATGLLTLVVWRHRSRPLRFALAIGAVLLAGGLWPGVGGRVLVRHRSFFGVVRVTDVIRNGRHFHRLFHASTLHGQQDLDPARRREPLTYYSRTGPIGEVFDVFRGRPISPGVAIVGLGAGSLACYAEPARRWTFFEIDPAVERIARDPRLFTHLRDCRAGSLAVVLGDARLRLREAPDRSFGLIVLDAFSSDALPVHLVTREAIGLYRTKLAEGGLLAFQITNRYFDLEPVLGDLADDAGLACRVRAERVVARAERDAGKEASIWAVMAPREADLGPLAGDPRWHVPRRRRGARVWTDDYSDPAAAFLATLPRFRTSHRPGEHSGKSTQPDAPAGRSQ